MKIIIVGCGKVGLTLAEQLTTENHDVTVIDQNYNKLRQITDSIDVMCIEGNGLSSEILLEAGIKEADILIATTESDEKNVMVTLIAKSLGNKHQAIARIRTPEYIPEIRHIKDELNMAMVLNPEYETAAEISRLIRYPSSVKRRDAFAKGRVEMLSVQIPKNSQIEGLRIKDLHRTLHSNILICAIEREGEVYIPNGDFILHESDVISFVGTHAEQLKFFKELKLATGVPKSVIIIGGSSIGYYLAKSLEEMPMTVKIIDVDLKKCQELAERLPKATIINGDASEKGLLLEEGVENAGAVISLTGIDEENIMMSLYARSLADTRTITKINRITFEGVISNLDIGSVVNPKLITADRIVRYIRGMENSLGSNIETLYTLANGKIEALEFRVTKEFEALDTPLMELSLKKGLLLACIYRSGSIVIPRGQDHLQVNDTVIVVTTQKGLNDLNDILK